MNSFEQRINAGLDKVDRDVDLLLSCAREVLEEIGEPQIAKALNRELPTDLDIPAEKAAQALSIAFQMMNLVEENAANQAGRVLEANGDPSTDTGSWSYWLNRIKEQCDEGDKILETIRHTPVYPVLTGHPTEAKRWSVLAQHRQLYLLLVELENQMYTPSERQDIRERIKAIIELIWRSGEILVEKPDVASERDNILYYLKEKFPEAIQIADIRYREAMTKAGITWDESDYTAYPQIHFGSWVGGDRDGHPLVTAGVTRETLSELRKTALDTINRRLKQLAKNMALSKLFQDTPQYLLDRIAELTEGKQNPTSIEEPWRAYVDAMRRALPRGDRSGFLYNRPSELICDLELLRKSLSESGAARLAKTYVTPEIRFVDTFGFHMAALDIRQNSGFHDRAMSQLLTAAGVEDADSFPEWSEETRVSFLTEELKSIRPFAQNHDELGAEAREAVGCLKVVAEEIRKNGRSGVGPLIISMTRSLSDLLVAQTICREAGLARMTDDGLVCLMPVSPLFETLDDLENSESIMDAFLSHPVTNRSLAWQDRGLDEKLNEPNSITIDASAPRIQEAMLGYSDSNKDSGIVSSQWGLFNAQARLVKIGEKHKVALRFFHGRGGTVSRGAGPTHRFLEALPAGSLQNGARVTEQGEVIAQKYNNFLTSARNLELLVAGSVGPQLCQTANEPDETMRSAMSLLSEYSSQHYRGLLEEEGFLSFYRTATPIDALEQSRIGSRPSRRSGKPSLKDLRAIPWVFSWTQSRFYMPGWYGVGTAFERLKEEKPEWFAKLKEQAKNWPFLRYVLYNIESSVESADGTLMETYASLVPDEAIRDKFLKMLFEERQRVRDALQELLNGPLEKRRPRFFKTLHARDKWLDLLHFQQIELLKIWRKSKSEDDLRRVLQSINAVAAGLRTTG